MELANLHLLRAFPVRWTPQLKSFMFQFNADPHFLSQIMGRGIHRLWLSSMPGAHARMESANRCEMCEI